MKQVYPVNVGSVCAIVEMYGHAAKLNGKIVVVTGRSGSLYQFKPLLQEWGRVEYSERKYLLPLGI